ncbi:phosphate acyltransferase PlsX [Candidatus Endomicrobiellum agilis]|jgi:glycerol-3-phosphate acyltransferase PlsX|uniref:phosphate acyltransferase PlsX n=1 Tax=Candidatus Endomicrobiellum agilis TaxID=3238957 RepID=UPI0028427487|nr:phosphate acyltransferase PlsX [Endomicrobium sp.]MCA6085533.1 phosphate acyltransferase PlsX [Endomicrobium sp.]MDR3092621.1 phosphate acyltransferase PlsX [Endomicrobium sp.]
MIIALDAMGGDFAPVSTVEGAIFAARESRHKILLVGSEKIIAEELLKQSKQYSFVSLDNIKIVNATEFVTMDEHPAKAIRQKKDSSLSVCARLVAEGKADAFVSMGNSGAAMSAALFYLKRIEGVLRPAISTAFPSVNGYCIIADMGANVDCVPEYLLQFGIMASLFCEKVTGVKNPRIGLVSIGEEPTKGNELTLAAFDLLRKAEINFIGNVEGGDIVKDKVDVAVCDGFVGNVILKFGEGLTEMMLKLVRKEVKQHPITWASLPFLWLAIRDLRKKVDYSESGGAPLLGVDGVCIIGHGKSNGKAVKNAILAGARAAEHNLAVEIKEAIARYNNKVM